MNSVHLTGRLCSEVTLSERSDTQVASIRLAVQRPRGKDGEDKGADYVDVTAFGAQAQVCAKYLAKGRKIAVDGHLHHSEWDSENGRRQKLEVIARNVEFLDSPKQTDQPAEPATAAAA